MCHLHLSDAIRTVCKLSKKLTCHAFDNLKEMSLDAGGGFGVMDQKCGIFSEKLPGVDCVSIGPNNYDIHTTEERLSLSSLERVWEFLLRVLSEI